MKALILGSGAREHAIARALGRAGASVTVYPGNAGIFRDAFLKLSPRASDPLSIARAATHDSIELCVIGPEHMLAAGCADVLRAEGMAVVGPSKLAAQLESSKLFAKCFMQEAGIPTADFSVVYSLADAIQLAETRKKFPCVLKYDGLAAGKGVVVAHNQEQMIGFAKKVFEHKVFGEESHAIVIEDFIGGHEISYIGLCDGKHFLPLSSATDYKRVGDSDAGPNTGGMGALSPSPFLTPNLESRIHDTVVRPFLEGLLRRALDYRGAIFFGLMIDSHENPHVLEFNVRFGDPETQAILLRLESDFLELCMATACGRLAEVEPPRWTARKAVYVVAATEGYPEQPVTGDRISGLESVDSGVTIFSAGIEKTPEGLVTSAGRVLGVGALGDDLFAARKTAYEALSHIHWRGQHFRNDIGLLDDSNSRV